MIKFPRYLSFAVAVSKILQGGMLLLHIDSWELKLEHQWPLIRTELRLVGEIPHKGITLYSIFWEVGGLSK